MSSMRQHMLFAARSFWERAGGAVASWFSVLVSGSSAASLGILRSALGQDTFTELSQHLSRMPLSTQVNKWVPADLTLGVTV